MITESYTMIWLLCQRMGTFLLEEIVNSWHGEIGVVVYVHFLEGVIDSLRLSSDALAAILLFLVQSCDARLLALLQLADVDRSNGRLDASEAAIALWQ